MAVLDPQIIKAIENAVEKKINGKLDSLCEEIKGYRKEHQAHLEDIKPIIDGLNAVKIGRKGIFWVTSIIAAIGGAILIIKRLLS